MKILDQSGTQTTRLLSGEPYNPNTVLIGDKAVPLPGPVHVNVTTIPVMSESDPFLVGSDKRSSLMSVMEGLIHIRTKQDTKWGEQNHPDFFPVFNLNTGEFLHVMEPANRFTYYQLPLEEDAKHDCDNDAKRGKLSWGAILKEEVCEAFGTTNDDDLEAELFDVLGVTAAWIQCIRRRREKAGK